MTGLPFQLTGMTGLYGRILGIESFDRKAPPAEPWGKVALSARGMSPAVILPDPS